MSHAQHWHNDWLNLWTARTNVEHASSDGLMLEASKVPGVLGPLHHFGTVRDAEMRDMMRHLLGLNLRTIVCESWETVRSVSMLARKLGRSYSAALLDVVRDLEPGAGPAAVVAAVQRQPGFVTSAVDLIEASKGTDLLWRSLMGDMQVFDTDAHLEAAMHACSNDHDGACVPLVWLIGDVGTPPGVYPPYRRRVEDDRIRAPFAALMMGIWE